MFNKIVEVNILKEDLRFPHQILKENGYLPEWLEILQEIDTGIAHLCKKLSEYLDGSSNIRLKEDMDQELA